MLPGEDGTEAGITLHKQGRDRTTPPASHPRRWWLLAPLSGSTLANCRPQPTASRVSTLVAISTFPVGSDQTLDHIYWWSIFRWLWREKHNYLLVRSPPLRPVQRDLGGDKQLADTKTKPWNICSRLGWDRTILQLDTMCILFWFSQCDSIQIG